MNCFLSFWQNLHLHNCGLQNKSSDIPHMPDASSVPHRMLDASPVPHRMLDASSVPHRMLDASPVPHRMLDASPEIFSCIITAAILFSCFCIPVNAFEGIPSEHDSDLNGSINAIECVMLMQNSLESDDYAEKYDFSHDDSISYDDIAVIKEYLLGYTVSFSSYPDDYILEDKGVVHTGEATYYGGGYVGGCAMLDPVSEEYLITAMNFFDWNTAQLAGAFIEVTGERGTEKFYVTDLLPEGKKGDLDLHVDAFPLVADPVKGRVPISWRIIPFEPLEKSSPVSYRFKDGSTQYWCGVQVRNHRYPIAKFEYLNEDGEFVELPRQNYNYFTSMDMGAGPFTFRVTDIYGQVIVDENIELIAEGIVEGQHQFPR